MANFVLSAAGVFPDGTSVGAYPASRWGPDVPSGAPKGSAVESQSISGSQATYTTLNSGETYHFAAQVNSVWRYLTGTVGEDAGPLTELRAAADAAVATHSADTTAVHGIADTAKLPYVLAQSAVAVVAPANTNENVLATITVPAGAMGANGRVRIWATFTATNNANVKTLRFRFAGGSILTDAITSAPVLALVADLANRNSASSQHGVGYRQGFFGAAATTTGAINTAVAQDITITAQKATVGADTITLEQYVVEVLT